MPVFNLIGATQLLALAVGLLVLSQLDHLEESAHGFLDVLATIFWLRLIVFGCLNSLRRLQHHVGECPICVALGQHAS